MNCKKFYDTITSVIYMTIVFKVSDKLKEKMITYYEDKRREKTPPYAVFQAMDADTIITLYESGKVMFQGISADVDANMWVEIEKKLTGRDININEGKEKKDKEQKERNTLYNINTIGSDEVGTGDFFGPIVVTATYVSKDKVELIEKLGVKDSKKLTDEKILSIAPTLIKEIPSCTYILNNTDYNKYQDLGYNMNKIKAILHNKVLFEMKQKGYDYDKIVVDQFVYPRKYFEHLTGATNIVRDIYFVTKAESLCASVAVASCISRYIFLKKMDELSDTVHVSLPKGAGENVDKVAAEIIKTYGEAKLLEIAKCNFKNMEKCKEY